MVGPSGGTARRARQAAVGHAIAGLGAAGALPIVVLGTEVLRLWYAKWWLQLACAALTVCVIARWAAPWALRSVATAGSSPAPIMLAPAALLAGTFVGSLTSIVVAPSQPLAEQFYDYVAKPMYWLTLVGVPLSLPFGVSLRRSLRRISASNAD